MRKTVRPYGVWPSPITAELAAGKSRRFGMLAAADGALYWSENRPEEQGRAVLMRAFPGGDAQDVLPAPWSARSRVHEYGGGEFLVHGGEIFFVEADSQDIYVLRSGGEPRALSQMSDTRFADMVMDRNRDRLIAVAEREAPESKQDHPENFLAAVAVGDKPATGLESLVSGQDFYASPRLAPDGKTLAWLAWNLPAMPWEAASLYVASLDEGGRPAHARRIAGGNGNAVFQPEWTEAGELLFVWDESGWGNLYAWDGENVRQVTKLEAELFRPQWVFGMRSYCLLPDGKVAAIFLVEGEPCPRTVDPATGKSIPQDTSLREVSQVVPFDGGLGVIGAGDLHAPSVMRVSATGGEAGMLRSGMEADLKPEDISAGEILKIPAAESDGTYALYYPPANASCEGPDGELPPAVVTVHGGPTGQADRGFKIKTQFWTSRGFAVCDIDYGGSSGYGRAYRERLDGQWGIRDVADVKAATGHLVARGLADPARLVISGGSAGGYTVLMALATLDVFAAGGCGYAVCDLVRLQQITHKFEAGYLYRLTGTTAENCAGVFAARSPLNLADGISVPVIFFQGSEDKVVPPEQSRAMADVLRANGVKAGYHEFEGEGHGFRRAETIEAVLRLEYEFYCGLFGLRLSPG